MSGCVYMHECVYTSMCVCMSVCMSTFLSVCSVLRCHGLYVWSFVSSLVTLPAIPLLSTEKQAEPAEYSDQGPHAEYEGQKDGVRLQTVPELLHELGDRRHYEKQTE